MWSETVFTLSPAVSHFLNITVRKYDAALNLSSSGTVTHFGHLDKGAFYVFSCKTELVGQLIMKVCA